MRMLLQKSEGIDNWYLIVRREHDGREWIDQKHENAFYYMRSDRLSPEADIEGSGGEMVAIAHAIKKRSYQSFRRVGVKFNQHGKATFWSPKNSRKEVPVTLAEADELADQILLELKYLNIEK